MVKDQSVETCCHQYTCYSFQLTARNLLYAPSHRQDTTYHGLCYTNCGALNETRNSSMGPSRRIDPTTHCTKNRCSTSEYKKLILFNIRHPSVNPLSYFSFQPVLHGWCNKGCGMCYPVCGMVHIKEPLLLIDKSFPKWWQLVSFLTIRMVFNHMYDTI